MTLLDEAREREPEIQVGPGGVPVRMIDGYLELLAWTRYLIETGGAGAPTFAQVTGQVDLLLERALAFKDRHGFPESDWQEGLFAVCVWMDERILCSSWEGRGPWLSSQLQRRFFNTTRGGELFFDRLAALPETAGQVREVFDYCLSLGFQGRYFAPEDHAALQDIRTRNLAGLPPVSGLDLEADLFPGAGRTLPADPGRRRIPVRHLFHLVLILIPPAVFALAYWGFKAYLDGLLKNLLG